MPVEALIDFAQPQGPAAGQRLRGALRDPVQVWQADAPDQVPAVLDAVEQAARAGHWCVGYVAYEAAPAFDAALVVHAPSGPLAWFAAFSELQPWPLSGPDSGGSHRVDWNDGPTWPRFAEDVDHIQAAIAAGECYQINHTAPLSGVLEHGSAKALFAALQQAQPGGYAMCLDAGTHQVLSVSPELFFDWDGQSVWAQPMKGTAPRGHDPQQDTAQAEALRASEKERAENVMIVDLIRNDLSRVALPHTVRVPRLFELHPLSTVWQMTSDVTARTRPGARLSDLFAALFPCGSVTGAPKVQAMHHIRALETGPRGVYCGALGVVRPGGHATFNVAIRTLTLQERALRCGIGSGITSGATAAGEWQEWRHKRAFLERASAPFDLLETLALVDGVWRNATEHLARLAASARHFAYPVDASLWQHTLERLRQSHPLGTWRVRLCLPRSGALQAEAHPMAATPVPVSLRLATRPFLEADSEFVRHKTTRRAHYEAFAPTDATVFDTVLWNERGELTECTRGNLALCIEGTWLTPARHCGLLAGVGRGIALEQGVLREAVLYPQDLQGATELAFVNSLRGWLPARCV